MKLVVGTKVLAHALKKISKVISNKGTMPVLSNVLLRMSDVGLELIGSNGEVSMVLVVGVDLMNDKGDILLPFDFLNGVVQKSKSSTVTFERKQKTIDIQAGKSVFQTPLLDPEQYPSVITRLEEGQNFWLVSDELKRMLESVVYAASTEEIRPVLRSVNLSIVEGHVRAIATDAHKFGLSKVGVTWSNEDSFSVLLPAVHCKPLLEFPVGVDIKVTVNQNMVEFAEEHSRVLIRPIDGTFPNVDPIIKYKSQGTLTLLVSELMGSLDRSLLVGSGQEPVSLSCVQNVLTVSRQGERGLLREEIEGQGNMNCSMFFDPKMLLDACRVIEAEKVQLVFQGNEAPFVLLPCEESERSLHIVVPLRARANANSAA